MEGLIRRGLSEGRIRMCNVVLTNLKLVLAIYFVKFCRQMSTLDPDAGMTVHPAEYVSRINLAYTLGIVSD